MNDGEDDRALACFVKAARLAPGLAEAQANLGYLLAKCGKVEVAERHYRRAIALAPTIAETHLNLGGLLLAQRRLDAAEAAFREYIRLRPASAAGWSNLGVTLACGKREEEAEACQRTALGLDPDYAKARFNLAYLLLRQGRFEEGWLCLEARDWYAPLAARLPFPRWQGESLAGKSLLLTYEAGHGDVIQFCRYAAELKAHRAAAIVGLICHPALKRLLADLADVDRLIAFDEDLPGTDWDYWSPLLSIPHHLGTRLDTIPAPIPYLRAEPALVARWRPELPATPLRVGLAWRGNPRFENDGQRSLPALATLAPLGSVPGVGFVSLQRGAGEDEAAQPSPELPVLDLGSKMEDFADAAAIMTGLDLVISVDTAMAHLAGALGVPCWLLLPDYLTDWRWLKDRTDSPWYPGVMRLFRQPRTGDWDAVARTVRDELAALAATKEKGPPQGRT